MSSYRRRPLIVHPSQFLEPLEPRTFLSGSPDLVAVAMDLNATGVPVASIPAIPGHSVFVEADFSIDVTTHFDPKVHVQFIASRDATLDTGDRILADVPVYDELFGGSIDRLTIDITIPKNLGSGDWHLIAYINPLDANGHTLFPEDSDKLFNNVAVSTGVVHVLTPAEVAAQSLADVAAALGGNIADKIPDSILTGTGGKISVNVTNPLPITAAANVSVSLIATNEDTAAVVPLGSTANKLTTFTAHATKAFPFNPTFPSDTPAGNYLLSAQVTLSDAQGNVLVTFTASDPDAITVGPPVRDLAAQFDNSGIPAITLVPGDVVKPSLVVSDNGNVSVKGTVLINYYASVDTAHVDGDGDILIAAVPTKLNVTLTTPQTVTPSLTLPGNLTPGSYHIVAVIDPVIGGNTPGADPNDANNQAATVAENVAWEFGNISGRAKSATLTLLDPDNTKAVFSLKGTGMGTVAAGDANGWDLTITGTDAKSTATIAASGGADGRIKLRNVTINAPLDPAAALTLKSLTASAVDFRGNILLKDIGAITAGSIGSDATQITFTANSIGTLKILGDFRNTDVLLIAVDSPATPKTRTLAALTVAGDVNNVQLRSRGSIGAVTGREFITSLIFAGLASETDTTLPDAADDFDADASIDSLNVAGFVPAAGDPFGFVNTLIAASRVGTVTVIDPNDSNGGVPFGIAATSVKALTIKDALGKTILKPTATQIVAGDFVVRIV